MLQRSMSLVHLTHVLSVLLTHTHGPAHLKSIRLQSKDILAQLLVLLTQSGPFGPVRGSGLLPWCRLMLRRKLDQTGIWVWFKGKVKKFGGGEQMLSWSKSGEFCWSSRNDVTTASVLSAHLNSSRFWVGRAQVGIRTSLLLPLPWH